MYSKDKHLMILQTRAGLTRKTLFLQLSDQALLLREKSGQLLLNQLRFTP